LEIKHANRWHDMHFMQRTNKMLITSNNEYRILVMKLTGKQPLEEQKKRWEDNIKAEFSKINC
jgi:hypothetical protein